MKTIIATLIAAVVVIVIGVGAFVYSGVYNIGADVHHSKPVFALIETLVDRSVARRDKDIALPNLDNPQSILAGAGQYAARCSGCHLAPGQAENALRRGLYPQPPHLARFHPEPRHAFWVIKHGIKMSAMPAWGDSLDDARIWSLVAFLEKMPDLTPAQYQEMVAEARADDGGDALKKNERGASADAMHAAANPLSAAAAEDSH